MLDIIIHMPISPTEITALITLASIIFLIAPLFLIIYVLQYNRKKKKHEEEKVLLLKTLENELLRTQMEVQEQTLKTIAYDLHDNIGQLLSLTTITLSSIDLTDTDKAAAKIALVEDLTSRSTKEVKALSRLLHSEELISRGLFSAIEFELEWIKRSDRFKITFEKPDFDSFVTDSSKETIVFRLFQEIINNIIQHSKATEIVVTLDKFEGALRLNIQDNGVGFNVEETLKRKNGMGLYNIKKRAAIINGTAIITSVIGAGSDITIIVPY
jgi:signal transduction histidine kinase